MFFVLVVLSFLRSGANKRVHYSVGPANPCKHVTECKPVDNYTCLCGKLLSENTLVTRISEQRVFLFVLLLVAVSFLPYERTDTDTNIHRLVPQKSAHFLYALTLSNIDKFSNLFQC